MWRLAARVPYLGRSLRTARGLAVAADDLARDALPALATAAGHLDPKALRPSGDRVDLARLAAAQGPLVTARDAVAKAEAAVRRLPASGVVGPVRTARAGLLRQLVSLRSTTADAAAAATVGPSMLGRDGRRVYLLALLNNAEMRGSGGLLGVYGLLEADHGRLRLLRLGTNGDLVNTPAPVVDLGTDFAVRYRRFSSDSFWVNGNMSPHFPDASAIWTGLWARTHGGQRLDGTIAVDPVALAGILRATGPARLPSGEAVTAERVVAVTESEAYVRFARDNAARDRFLQDVARAVYGNLVSGRGDTHALLTALGTAAGGGNVHVASAHPAEEAVLAPTPVAGVLPSGTGAFLEVVTQNAGGNKLDYYLRRTVTRTRTKDGTVTVTVRLRNVAPAGLPTYVSGRLDLPPGTSHVDGAQHEYVSVYASTGAGLFSATLDGQPLAMESEAERGHPVFSTFLDLNPGRDTVLTLTLLGEPPGPVTVRQPPLVVPDEVRLAG